MLQKNKRDDLAESSATFEEWPLEAGPMRIATIFIGTETIHLFNAHRAKYIVDNIH